MLEVAKNKNNDKKIDYCCIAMEDLSFSKNIFNIIISSLVCHYVKDFKS